MNAKFRKFLTAAALAAVVFFPASLFALNTLELSVRLETSPYRRNPRSRGMGRGLRDERIQDVSAGLRQGAQPERPRPISSTTRTTSISPSGAYDTDPSKIKASLAKRDDMYNDDIVGIVVDTYNTMQNGYAFLVNPLGIQGDGIMNADGNVNSEQDFIWDSKGRLDGQGYAVEYRIPLQSIRFPAGNTITLRLAYLPPDRPDFGSGQRPAHISRQGQHALPIPAHRGHGVEIQARRRDPPGRHPQRPESRRSRLPEKRGTDDRPQPDGQGRLDDRPDPGRDGQSRLQPGRSRRRAGGRQPPVRPLLCREKAVSSWKATRFSRSRATPRTRPSTDWCTPGRSSTPPSASSSRESWEPPIRSPRSSPATTSPGHPKNTPIFPFSASSTP